MRAMVLPAAGSSLLQQERDDPTPARVSLPSTRSISPDTTALIRITAQAGTQTTAFPLGAANDVLTRLRTGQTLDAAVLQP